MRHVTPEYTHAGPVRAGLGRKRPHVPGGDAPAARRKAHLKVFRRYGSLLDLHDSDARGPGPPGGVAPRETAVHPRTAINRPEHKQFDLLRSEHTRAQLTGAPAAAPAAAIAAARLRCRSAVPPAICPSLMMSEIPVSCWFWVQE